MPDNALLKQALDMLQHQVSENSEWIETIKFVLTRLGLTDHFQNVKLVRTKTFKEIVKTRLSFHFTELWHGKLSGDQDYQNNSKLKFYKIFKKSHEREPYLDFIPDFHIRKIITKFRCSDHILEIEKGRHKNKKVEARLCKLCNKSIEDEIHFLNNCDKYNSLRLHYFGNPGTQNWVKIVKCKTKESAFKLGNYLKKGFMLRKKFLILQNT